MEDIIDNTELTNVQDEDSFVGIYYLNGKFDIKFPLGYKYTKIPNNETDKNVIRSFEKQRKKDIVNLIRVLVQNKSKHTAHKEIADKTINNYEFPLYAYMQVFTYYKKHGYYVPKTTVYKKSSSGKVNWNRTIKQINPIISNGNIIYLETIRNNNNYNENELIAIINRYCVYQSYIKAGCLISTQTVKEEKLKIGIKTCIRVLNNKIKNTFNSEELELFKNMKKILETESNETNNSEYYFGTTTFHTIWESMVNSFFGESNLIREKYNPHLRWFDHNGSKISGQASTLRPDTIAFKYEGDDKKVFILDSKYYKGSVNLDDGNLPLSESVPKQLVYANWAINKMGNENKNVFNAFIMPAELANSDKAEQRNKLKIEYYGFVKPEWLDEETEFKNPEKPYNRIQGIKIDTKDLMENYLLRNKTDIDFLMEIIEKEANNLGKY